MNIGLGREQGRHQVLGAGKLVHRPCVPCGKWAHACIRSRQGIILFSSAWPYPSAEIQGLLFSLWA